MTATSERPPERLELRVATQARSSRLLGSELESGFVRPGGPQTREVGIHEITLGTTGLAFDLAVQVRNKALDAYKEVINTPLS